MAKGKKQEPLKLHWRDHNSQYKRVWFTDWFGDQFQVMDNESFMFLENVCRRFNIVIEQADDD